MKHFARAAVAVLVLQVAGCGGAGRQLAADVDDYERYRRTRTATTLEAKLRASWEYLRHEPDGRWSEDVRAWFYPTEAAYYAAARDDAAALDRYLDALPDGPNARRAADAIVAMESLRAKKSSEARTLTAFAGEIEQELAESARNRRALVRSFVDWTRRLAAIDTWGRRTSELPAELIFAWRGERPEARCVGLRCVKAYSIGYAIPVGGRQDQRQALMDVVIELDRNGGVARGMITGPELFSRIGEAIQMSAVAPGDLQARAESIARAADLARHAIEPARPADRCAREAVAPTIVSRSCDGVRVEMVAAATFEDEDRIEVRPAREPGE